MLLDAHDDTVTEMAHGAFGGPLGRRNPEATPAAPSRGSTDPPPANCSTPPPAALPRLTHGRLEHAVIQAAARPTA
ncbi:hypothetical protein [Streptomyces sp. B21-083]|uniref:hypothetical protein n=1 Tax=Streptomyces sp. B21-083 TaxID=3039410 RepID=UPI002FF3C3F3